jgi:hypothetical protein
MQAAPKIRRVFGAPLVITLFFLGMMLPTSVSVSVGGLRLSVYWVVLLVALVPMLAALITGKKGRFNGFDALAIGHALWAMLALQNWGGLGQGTQSGGIYVVEFLGSYLVGRIYVRSVEDFRAVARLFVGATCLTVLFTLPEALTGVHILYDSITKVFGGPPAPYIEPRMGLTRAFGPFDHPILYGVFSASAFSMAYFVIAERRLTNFRGMAQVATVCVAAFLSASGGPYTGLIMQVFVAAWQRVFAKVEGRWKMLFGLFGTVYVLVDLLSTRTPFHVFVTYLTFSAVSGYNRILIFQFGTAEVMRHPLFGIGLGDWIRPVYMSDSMDNFWLVVAVRYGLPALGMLVALMAGLMWTAAHRRDLPQSWRNARHAWAFTLFGISVAAATVHLWNALFVLFVFLIGSGVWLTDAPLPKDTPRRAVAPRGIPSRLF